jgi:hypothetical protein
LYCTSNYDAHMLMDGLSYPSSSTGSHRISLIIYAFDMLFCTDEEFIMQQASLDFFYNYNALLLGAFGLQYAIDRSPGDLLFWAGKVCCSYACLRSLASSYCPGQCSAFASNTIIACREMKEGMAYSPKCVFDYFFSV